MKPLMLTMVASSLFVVPMTAQHEELTTETLKVYGNCGMCKNTIEKAATSVRGVDSADWNMETDTITVRYDNRVTNADAILQAIADKGYDSDSYKATDKAYYKLPACCQYERPNRKE